MGRKTFKVTERDTKTFPSNSRFESPPKLDLPRKQAATSNTNLGGLEPDEISTKTPILPPKNNEGESTNQDHGPAGNVAAHFYMPVEIELRKELDRIDALKLGVTSDEILISARKDLRNFMQIDTLGLEKWSNDGWEKKGTVRIQIQIPKQYIAKYHSEYDPFKLALLSDAEVFRSYIKKAWSLSLVDKINRISSAIN